MPTTIDPKSADQVSELFEQGLEVRKAVLGEEYVTTSLGNANEFMMAFQTITTEWCWGRIWAQDGLDRKTRSLINITMITALNRMDEVEMHVKGALRNGVTVNEIKEALLQATVYCGIPAGLSAFKVANRAINEYYKNKNVE